MEFSIATLLASFAPDKSLTAKSIEHKLGLRDESQTRRLQIALDALEKAGLLDKERGRYRRVETVEAIETKLRCSSKGFCFAIQDDDEAEDIYVRESQLSNAWNGDRVLVKVTREVATTSRNRRRSPEGAVTLVLDRANRSVLARVVPGADGHYRAEPLDDRLLFKLDLVDNGTDYGSIEGYLVNIEVLRYAIGQYPPLGRITKVLGVDAESASDLDIVTCKYGLADEFPEAALAEAAALPAAATEWSARDLTALGLANHRDRRSELTVALVPVGEAGMNQPIDAALSLEPGPGGTWQITVHTVDLARYIPAGSPLDREARQRGAAVYLGENVLPLFPDVVGAGLGSFLPGCDRAALSIELVLDSEGRCQRFSLQPSLVRADLCLSHGQIAAFLDASQPDPEVPQAGRVSEWLGHFKTIATLLRGQRFGRGSFDVPSAKGRSFYGREDDRGTITDPLTARALLAEVMIAANAAVASHLRALGLPALYRVQAAPNATDVQETLKLVVNLGLDLAPAAPDMIEPQDIQQFLQQAIEPQTRKILSSLLLPTLRPPHFSATPRPHFALALEQYVTFNAPARHYADFLTQRVLTALFDQGRDRRSARVKEGVNLQDSTCHGAITWAILPADLHQDLETDFALVAGPMSDRERTIQDAAADIVGLKRTAAMQDCIGQTFNGTIVGVQSYGFFVELDGCGVEGLVHVSSLKDDWYEYRSRQQVLIGRRSRRQYALGSPVEVQVCGVDYYRQQIDLAAAGTPVIAEDDADTEQDLNDDEFEPLPPDHDQGHDATADSFAGRPLTNLALDEEGFDRAADQRSSHARGRVGRKRPSSIAPTLFQTLAADDAAEDNAPSYATEPAKQPVQDVSRSLLGDVDEDFDHFPSR